MKNLIICLLITGCVFSLQTPLHAQNPQKLFQKGIIQEEGEGDLTKAIEIYNSLVNDMNANRALRAKALLHVGICYEKLGNQNARKTYQKLISEYADQTSIVALGKEKLKGLKKVKLTKKNGGIIASQVKFSEGEGGRISSDGESLIYVDWTTKDDKPAINIKNLRNGKTRIVSKVGTWNAPIKFPTYPVWSPDGKQFAYYWYDKNQEECEFHIANSDGTNDSVIAKGSEAPSPHAWSPDGKYILCVTESNEGSKEIALFSVKDRTSKILKRTKKNGSSANFSPDSKYIVYAMQQAENPKENDIYLMSIDGSIDKKIISNAANDINPHWSTDGRHLIFLSDRLGKNDLWKIRIENGLTIGTAKLVKSNLSSRGDGTTILGITKDQTLYYETASSRKDIYLLNMDLTGKTTTNAPKRISDLKVKNNRIPAISNDGRYIAFAQFQLERDPDIIGHMFIISIYDTKTEEIKILNSKIFTLAQLYWYYPNLQWSPNGDKILLQGRIKDNENIIAGVFSYDVKTEEFETILEVSDFKGFIDIPSTGTGHTFSNDGKNIYYLNTDRKNILKTEIESKKASVLYTSAKTLAYFKMSKDASKIAYIYEDNLGEIYVETINDGKPNKIVSFNGDDQTVKLIGWDSDDNYIYYAENESWVSNAIMRISAEGGTPKLITNLKDTFPDGEIQEIIIDSKNGLMAIDLGIRSVEMWKLEGVFDE